MLGYVLGITLVLTALSPLIFTDIFADSFVVNFDKPLYDVGDSLTVSGEIAEIGMPMIAMSIYDPDGKILSANSLEISPEKIFTKTILLDSPFYEKVGEYLVKLDYGKISENHYFVIKGESSNSEILIESFEDPEIISLSTEQKQYADKDVVKINGLVSVLDSPSVLIGIYDPFGMPAGFYFGTVDSNLEFTTSFLVEDGVNFRVDGTYSIKAHYAESKIISFFEYSKDSQIMLEEPIAQEPIAQEPSHEIRKQNNLTVEDVELGKLLNQISLKCDSNIFIDTISYYDGMGPALYRLCEFDNALNFFNESLIDNPDDVEILVNKGSTLGKLGYFSEAIVYYDHAINTNPNSLSAKNNKANALANMGNLNSAILLYDEILKQNPDYLTAKNNLKTALSLIPNTSETPSFQNISYQNPSLPEKINKVSSEKQKSNNFFDEVNTAFSSLGSLFGFLN